MQSFETYLLQRLRVNDLKKAQLTCLESSNYRAGPTRSARYRRYATDGDTTEIFITRIWLSQSERLMNYGIDALNAFKRKRCRRTKIDRNITDSIFSRLFDQLVKQISRCMKIDGDPTWLGVPDASGTAYRTIRSVDWRN